MNKHKPALLFPAIEPDVNKNKYRLIRPFSHIMPGAVEITAAPGIFTDGMTTKPWMWLLVGSPYDPRRIRAAVVHDLLYLAGSAGVSRIEADREFARILTEDLVPAAHVRRAYAGVRVGGWLHYGKGNPELLTIRRLTSSR